LDQRIRFCTSADGVRLAYAVHGSGPPLVKAANWLTHLEHDWESVIWRHWMHELARGHTVVRYDQRGCGLSDADPDDLTLDHFVEDLEAVVDAASMEQFDLLGISQGGALSIAFAVRHPERVRRLVLYGSYALGRKARAKTDERREAEDAMLALMREGWGRENPALRRMFSTLFFPGADIEAMEAFEELQRVSCTAENAIRLRRAWADLDVRHLLGQVTVPTLVMHARDDAVVPFEQGRLLAGGIPNAEFVPLESRNHLLLADEPAWERFSAELRAFFGDPNRAAVGDMDDLSPRELEVLELVAAGLGNDEIGERLHLSSRTVERHLSNVYVKLRISGKAARAAAAARFAELRGRT
jgi:pimeloyl-ACP methyl ester carboxylesterase/DNA-binding CsgD family transcriptional regulator